MSFIRVELVVDSYSMELFFLLGLVAAVGLPLALFAPGSRRRRAQVVELRDFTECLVDRAMSDPARLVVVDFLLAIVKEADLQEKCLVIAMAAKERLQVEHAEVNLLNGSGDIFIAGDSLSPQVGVSRKNSYCRLNLSGRPVVIKDSLANLMLVDNPYRERVRSYLGAPVIVQDEVVGVVCVYGDEPREWTAEEEQELVQMAAGVATELTDAVQRRATGGI
jgi:GAF domain-containing protein